MAKQRPSFSLELLPQEPTGFSLRASTLHISVSGPVAYYQLRHLYQIETPGGVDVSLVLAEEDALCALRLSQGERVAALSSARIADVEQLPEERHEYSQRREHRLSLSAALGDDLVVEATFARFLAIKGDEATLELPFSSLEGAPQAALQVSLEGVPVVGVQPAQLLTTQTQSGLSLRCDDAALLSQTDELRLRLSSGAPLSARIPQPDGSESLYCALPDVSSRDILPRRLTILFDCSGSMAGARFESAKRMIRSLCRALRPADVFCLKTFGAKPQETPWWSFDDASLQALDDFLAGLSPRGGEEFSSLLERVLALPGGVGLPTILLLTDSSSEGEPSLLRAVEEASLRGVRLHVVGLGGGLNQSFLRSLALSGCGAAFFVSRPQALDRIALQFERECSPVVTRLLVEGTSAPLPDMYQARSFSFWVQRAAPGPERLRLLGQSLAGPFSAEVALSPVADPHGALQALWAKARLEALLGDRARHQDEITQLGLLYLLETPCTAWVKQEGTQRQRLVKKTNEKPLISKMPLLGRARPIFLGLTPLFQINYPIQRLPTLPDNVSASPSPRLARGARQQLPDLAEFAPLHAPEPLHEFPRFVPRATASRFTYIRNHFSSQLSLQDRAEIALNFLLRSQRSSGSFGDPSVTSLVAEALALALEKVRDGLYQAALQRAQESLRDSATKPERLPCLVSKEQLLDAQKLIGGERGGVLGLGDSLVMTAFLVRELLAD